MKSEPKRRLILTAGVMLGVPASLCLIFIGLLWWGFCYGVDPLSWGEHKQNVSACRATQRMGDKRLYIFLDNRNECEVTAELSIDVFNNQTRKSSKAQVHTVLGPHSSRRIYPADPKESYCEIIMLSVTKHNQR